MPPTLRDFIGEFIGTFMLVFFGCGAVMVTVLFSAHSGLMQVALIWGAGVALSIYATRHISCAHLNPAVSIAMVVGRRMALTKLPGYLGGQFLGAFCAAAVLYGLFAPSIAQYETLHAIVRGSPSSVQTAMMFGEFYPNPGSGPAAKVPAMIAFFAEGIGTFALVFLIFALTEGCNLGRPDDSLAPLFIGLAVTSIIAVIAPLTQAGLNPARDMSPRLLSMLAGWGKAAMPSSDYVGVYVFGPICGGILAALFFTWIVEPLMRNTKNNNCMCR